jgi:hypothetical protein
VSRNMLPLVADIVSSQASGNLITSQNLTEVIKSVYAALNGLANGTTIAPAGSSGPSVRSPGVESAVPIKRLRVVRNDAYIEVDAARPSRSAGIRVAAPPRDDRENADGFLRGKVGLECGSHDITDAIPNKHSDNL